jgi:hypothetical protein
LKEEQQTMGKWGRRGEMMVEGREGDGMVQLGGTEAAVG